jgi:hypothetical protein
VEKPERLYVITPITIIKWHMKIKFISSPKLTKKINKTTSSSPQSPKVIAKTFFLINLLKTWFLKSPNKETQAQTPPKKQKKKEDDNNNNAEWRAEVDYIKIIFFLAL